MHMPAPSHTLSVPSITHVQYFSLGRPPAVCVGPWLLLSSTHRSIYLSSQVCLQQTHIYFPSSLLTVHAPLCSIRFHTGAHSRPSFHRSHTRTLLPLDIVCLSHHLLYASLSIYPSPLALFASNTYMHVYRSISLHIPRSTLTIFPHPSIDIPHKLCLSFL